jgi:hypothetical protein
MELPLAVNPSGSARCEPRFRTYLKRACAPVCRPDLSVGTGSTKLAAASSSSRASGAANSQALEYAAFMSASLEPGKLRGAHTCEPYTRCRHSAAIDQVVCV